VIGFSASFLLPARPGEVLRPYLLAKREGLPPTAAFATVILERLLVSLILSFPLWLSIGLGIWVTSRAFHMTFSYLGSFLVMTLLVVGVAMPTPGQIGGFHAMYRIAVVEFFGVPDPTAVAAGFVLHAISFVPVTALGLVFMAREGLTFARMKQMASENKQ
jgi:uncharacterized membrane protein YbhN (UPF0104 family)